MDAGLAPPTPTTTGGQAEAGVPNTLWARVWNLGRAPVYNARVEFYWFNPRLGFDQDSANLIGVTHVDLGHRYSGAAHRIVKCPVSWVPRYLNHGHEARMVRVFDPLTDPLTPLQWDANNDRHVGQRNIRGIDASSPAAIELNLSLGCGVPPGSRLKEIVGFTHPTLVRPHTDKATLKGLDLQFASKLLNQKLEFELAPFAAWLRGVSPPALEASWVSPGGFQAFEHLWALPAAFDFHRRIGKARVAARIHTLNEQCKEGLARMGHVRLRTPPGSRLSAGMVCFDVEGMKQEEVAARLLARRVVASVSPYGNPCARLAPSLLNTPEEVDAALREVRALAAA